MSYKRSLTDVCGELSMSGRIVIEATAGKTILRKRTYPVLTFLWCLLIMGIVCGLAFKFGRDTPFIFLFPFIGILLIAVFTGVAIYCDKKESILTYEAEGRMLFAPQRSEDSFPINEITLRVNTVKVKSGNHYEKGQLLFLIDQDGDELPLFFDNSSLEKKINMFCTNIGTEFEIGQEMKIEE